MIFSLIHHSLQRGWKPSNGWSHEYLALLTATNPKTVATSLATLAEHGFLSVLDGMRFRLFRLRDSQLECFADKKAWSGNSAEPDENVAEFGPGSERLDAQRNARAELAAYLEGFPITQTSQQKILSTIIQTKGWEAKWQKWAFEIVSKIL
jgi:hypothetical protein